MTYNMLIYHVNFNYITILDFWIWKRLYQSYHIKSEFEEKTIYTEENWWTLFFFSGQMNLWGKFYYMHQPRGEIKELENCKAKLEWRKQILAKGILPKFLLESFYSNIDNFSIPTMTLSMTHVSWKNSHLLHFTFLRDNQSLLRYIIFISN